MKTKILVICAVALFALQLFLKWMGHDAVWATTDLATWISHAFLFVMYGLSAYIIGAGKDPRKFVTRFMGATGLRFFLSLLFILILKYALPEPFKVHVVQFLILYMVYLMVDSWALMRGNK